MHTLNGQRSAAALAALSLAGALALTGCGAADDGRGTASDKAAVAPAQDNGAPEGAKGAAAGTAAPGTAEGRATQPPAAVRPNVIRTAALGIETDDPRKTLAQARTAADGAGGYVGSESTERGGDGRMTSTLTLRVPGDRFDAVLGAMEGSGRLLHRKVDAQDVTEKVADIGSRVASQQASVARVREMMGKASALSEVVMLEGELSRRQSDLESLLAQQTALKDQTSMGTITLKVSEPEPPAARKEKERDPGFTDALAGGWAVFSRIVRLLLLAVAAVLPFAIAAGLVWLGLRLYRKARPPRPGAGPVSAAGTVPGARSHHPTGTLDRATGTGTDTGAGADKGARTAPEADTKTGPGPGPATAEED
ncbi:DUF4349 domain-containing protein [Streptomyces sp. CB00455]|uniref:DUF4349 domain-containing protein n=1 Tax=Streptomyces sp. CB00455 TaxID=1703927 RepID=UPI00093E87A1|nr:DUF4349 domain-containing protein [Streptomyces sp. CB00455]